MYASNTPYHRRLAHRLALAKQRQQKYQNNRYTQIDRFMCQYENAFKEFYGVRIEVYYRHGWYYVNGIKYRHGEMERNLALLLARLQELESPNPDKETCYAG